MLCIHVLMNSSIWFAAMHLQKVHCSYEGGTAYIISVLGCTSFHADNIVILSKQIVYAAFHLYELLLQNDN